MWHYCRVLLEWKESNLSCCVVPFSRTPCFFRLFKPILVNLSTFFGLFMEFRKNPKIVIDTRLGLGLGLGLDTGLVLVLGLVLGLGLDTGLVLVLGLGLGLDTRLGLVLVLGLDTRLGLVLVLGLDTRLGLGLGLGLNN